LSPQRAWFSISPWQPPNDLLERNLDIRARVNAGLVALDGFEKASLMPLLFRLAIRVKQEIRVH